MRSLERGSPLLRNWPAVVILLAYLVVGSLYAVNTPVWQAPDEPAHYNYIRSLAEGEGIPVMETGDYDQAYLERLTAERFPPGLPVDPLEYEDHQPPLYYFLTTPVYLISQGSVVALRLTSLLLGGVAVAMVFLILREFWPSQPGIAWFGGGLVAFTPQYLAMMASVNNDALVLALLWLWLWLALRYLRGKVSPWILGGVAGALLLAKTTGYGVLPLMGVVVYLRNRKAHLSGTRVVRQLVALFVPALLLGGLWWGRNIVVYGWPDLLGLQAHDRVVFGQPKTAAWIAEWGFVSFLRRALQTTFRSFWGQFGWMGVVLDQRIYRGLLIFSTLAIVGAVWRLVEAWRRGPDPRQRDALILLGMSAVITLAMYVGYNLVYVQHQGRYLFPALPLLVLGAALGWQHLLHQRQAVGMALALLLVTAGVGIVGALAGDPPLWTLAMLGAAAVGLPVLAFVPERYHGALVALALVGMVVLDLWCLFGFIVPMLTA
ncbi:MAG: DUF2142 domain-containing protein [Anaerolineae bacterium]